MAVRAPIEKTSVGVIFISCLSFSEILALNLSAIISPTVESNTPIKKAPTMAIKILLYILMYNVAMPYIIKEPKASQTYSKFNILDNIDPTMSYIVIMVNAIKTIIIDSMGIGVKGVNKKYLPYNHTSNSCRH